jgi:hypothetical protein
MVAKSLLPEVGKKTDFGQGCKSQVVDCEPIRALADAWHKRGPQWSAVRWRRADGKNSGTPMQYTAFSGKNTKFVDCECL